MEVLMKTEDKRINKIRDQVEKINNTGSGRPVFPKSLKQEVGMLVQSGVSGVKLAQLTGLSISSVNRWGSKAATFRKVTKENYPKASSSDDFSFKLMLPNGISLASSSEILLKKIFELTGLQK